MQESNLEKVLNLFQILKDLELEISLLYQEAADRWSDEKDFWSSLVLEENKHAKNLMDMAELLRKSPEKFAVGRLINPIAVKTVIRGIDENINRIKNGKLNFEKMLHISLDIENSLLENKYGEIVESKDVEYGNLVKEIVEDTERHKHKIRSKIREYKKNDR